MVGGVLVVRDGRKDPQAVSFPSKGAQALALLVSTPPRPAAPS